MKKFPGAFLGGIIFCSTLFAQNQYGVAGQLVLSHTVKDSYSTNTTPLNFGFRLEGMKTKLGRDEFRFAYLGFALCGMAFTKETFTVPAISASTSDDTIISGTIKGNALEGVLRVGFEVPQHWNPFLSLNIGFGGGLNSSTQKSVFPDEAVPYSNYGYQRDYQSGKSFGYQTNLFVSVFYELEKFYLFFQEEVAANTSPTNLERFGIRSNFGIYYKLQTEE